MSQKSVFNTMIVNMSNGNSIHMLNIQSFTKDISDFIDKVIIQICEGNINTDLSIVKKRLRKYFETKIDSNLEVGAIAEFVCHCYMKELGYKQEFLYLNLEEGSIKKGFDGYYSKDSIQWILESKSGSFSTKGISHVKKTNEAYCDLRKKLLGQVDNNPWMNAYNHASHIDVGASKKLRDQLKELSDSFINEKYEDIKNYNIIPSSTIFHEGTWIDIEFIKLCKDIEELLNTLEYKTVQVICINKLSKKIFLEYLET